VLRLGSARLGSLRLYSARHGETPLEGGGGVQHSANASQYIYIYIYEVGKFSIDLRVVGGDEKGTKFL
jgi:hypothetical protein